MTTRNSKPEPWWHARSGALVALAIALGGGWIADTRLLAGAQATAPLVSREMDQLQARMAVLESACRDR